MFTSTALAVDIPTQLSRADLDEVTQLLGHSTSSKFLSNPFPLGGYSGFEVGFATEFVNTTDLSRLGAGTSKQSRFQYNRITIGKGLYNNVDVFLHFIPFSSANEVSEYGGFLKYNFYQGKFLPVTASILGYISTINIQDSFVNETLGADLLLGINLESVALYCSFGQQNARSTFAQNVLDTADPAISLNANNTFKTKSTQIHSAIGLHIEFSKVFLAAQIDRYEQPVYSAKLGVRF